jgi:hypothetical protein
MITLGNRQLLFDWLFARLITSYHTPRLIAVDLTRLHGGIPADDAILDAPKPVADTLRLDPPAGRHIGEGVAQFGIEVLWRRTASSKFALRQCRFNDVFGGLSIIVEALKPRVKCRDIFLPSGVVISDLLDG